MIEKTAAVASLGQTQLLRPAWTKAGLAANDRLKLYLTILQAAQGRAADTSAAPISFSQELAIIPAEDRGWLADIPASAFLEGALLHVPGLRRLLDKLRDDLQLMARPLRGDGDADRAVLIVRVGTWGAWLDQQQGDTLSQAQLTALTKGDRDGDDSFHILIMDLHKALNHLASEFSSETIDGAHVWQLASEDHERVAAFMRGLNRTRALKLAHPGLETAATRDGSQLVIPNDIGTNDAHVLVIHVEDRKIELNYSDLHRRRFTWFQQSLSERGARWSGVGARITAGLNADHAYQIGIATFACADEPALLATLEFVGSQIVFLIDWNRARKRLELFVGKTAAIAILSETARREVGHMGWLAAGGERLIHGAMQALGGQYFLIGERLDHVLGEAPAQELLIETLTLTSQAIRAGQAMPLIADDIRLLLLRYCRRQREEFGLLNEHAAFCHALAEGLHHAILHGHESESKQAGTLAERAKGWERQADLLVIRSRELATNRPSWRPFVELIKQADDIADAFEEAAFLLSLIAEDRDRRWPGEAREAIVRLASTALAATQDYIRALRIAQGLGEESRAEDQEEFITATWRVLDAERQSDMLLRDVRRALARHVDNAPLHVLTTDFAAAIEAATDALLVTTYGLRDIGFSRLESGA